MWTFKYSVLSLDPSEITMFESPSGGTRRKKRGLPNDPPPPEPLKPSQLSHQHACEFWEDSGPSFSQFMNIFSTRHLVKLSLTQEGHDRSLKVWGWFSLLYTRLFIAVHSKETGVSFGQKVTDKTLACVTGVYCSGQGRLRYKSIYFFKNTEKFLLKKSWHFLVSG